MPNIHLADSTRNARLNAILTDIGASGATLKLRDGTAPSTCAGADVGNVIATITLPNPWLGTAPGAGGAGTIDKAGTWSTTASFAGTITHFRIYAGGTTCKLQGSAGLAAGSPDMVVDNATVTVGQTINATVFTLTDANA